MEESILLGIQEHLRSPYLDPVMIFITHLGDSGWFWVVLTGIFLVFLGTRKMGATSALALVLSLLINNICLKNLVARIRPYDRIEGLVRLVGEQVDFSFPSGHSATSFAAAFVIFLNLPKRYGIPALVLAGLIAFSRLYVGVHYPTDVLSGMLSGIFCAVLAQFLVGRFWGRKKDGNQRV